MKKQETRKRYGEFPHQITLYWTRCMDGMCRDNVLTHIQGFGADYENMHQDKEGLTVYLCHG